ncbi:(4Fe-4S)-binding protein, partial [Candidatus Aerophobetes bacterium]|nr:(4Fe-4S)-binding protein [Candidatus Aerophobetes bacterium]
MKKINKRDMGEFVHSLVKDFTVYAPVNVDGIFLFKQVKSFEETRLDYKNSIKPPKEIFFPQSEVMFKYEKGKLRSTETVDEK